MRCDFTFRPIDNWPHQKTKRPKPSAFRSKYNQTLDLLNTELRTLGVRKAIIQIDLPESKIRFDGLPYSRANPVFQGVILSFESKYGPLRYATDVFNHWHDNLRAIALGLEALRKVDRYGITKKGEQYTGWKQLPASIETIGGIEKASEILARYSGYDQAAILHDKEIYRKAYRAAAIKLHPDKGGDINSFTVLQKIKTMFENFFK